MLLQGFGTILWNRHRIQNQKRNGLNGRHGVQLPLAQYWLSVLAVSCYGKISCPLAAVAMRFQRKCHGGGSTVFMSYQDRSFPLPCPARCQITADRHITYDFSLANEDSLRVWGAGVQDSYVLSNHSEQERTVSVLYPFAGSFNELAEQMPMMTVDGEAVSPALYPGGYSGGFKGVHGEDDPDGSSNILQLDSWEGYKTLLEGGSYQDNALSPYPKFGQTVTVYGFSDFKAPLGQYQAAIQAITFTINPEKTMILLYGFNGGEYGEDGQRRFSYFVPNKTRRESNEKYIIVMGDDIAGVTRRAIKWSHRTRQRVDISQIIIRTERMHPMCSMML